MASSPSHSHSSAVLSLRKAIPPIVIAIALTTPGLLAAAHVLEEPAAGTRVFSVTSKLEVTGRLETATSGEKVLALELKVDAVHKFRERRLPGAGRDALALRSLRYYGQATAQIDVSRQKTSSRLRNRRKLLVAQGRRDGVSFYSPRGTMTYNELELLKMPGDSLAALALLPPKPVELKEKWNAVSWAVQMLAGTDAVLKSDLICELQSVTNDTATVTFQGTIVGATAGAATTITLSGNYQFDVKSRYLTRLELTQHEKRSVGAVTPGMDVTAKVVLERQPAESLGPLTDAALARIPLEPAATLLSLRCNSPWSARFLHDRNWHVFHQSQQVVVLRLLDKGSLIAQCNVSKIPDAGPGKHTSEEQFQQDILTALGDKLKSIEKAELLKTGDERFLYRVTVVGEANGLSMHWLYYLCASPSGRQIAFVFAVESKLLEKLGHRDLGIVSSLEFLVPAARAGK